MRNILLVVLSLLLLHSCKPEEEDLPPQPDYPDYFDDFVGTYIGQGRSQGWHQQAGDPPVTYDTTYTDTITVDYYSATQLLVSVFPNPIEVDAWGSYDLSYGSQYWHFNFRNDSLFHSSGASFQMSGSSHHCANAKQ